MKLLGSNRIRTTTYYPEPNGLVEKWHKHLKASLMCCGITTDWYYTLPTVLLGLRTALRSDTENSAAEMIYGQALRIPGDFCDYLEPEVDVDTFMNEYRKYLKQVKLIPVPHKMQNVLKKDVRVKPPLTRPYTGPFKVIRRHPTRKYFKLDIGGDNRAVSTKWLKPAHFVAEDIAERFPEFLHLMNPTPLSKLNSR